MNKELLKDPTYGYPEVGVLLEDTNNGVGKFYIQAIMPFIEHDKPFDIKDKPYIMKNIVSRNKDLLDISESNLNSHIHDDNPHHITPYMIGAADSDHTHSYAGSAIAGGFANGVAYKQGTND